MCKSLNNQNTGFTPAQYLSTIDTAPRQEVVRMRNRLLVVIAMTVLVCLLLAEWSGSVPWGAAKSLHVLEVDVRDLESHVDELMLAREVGAIMAAAYIGDFGILYSDDRGREVLSRLGIAYDILLENVREAELFLITKSAGVERHEVERYSTVLAERDSYFLVCPQADDIHRVYLLPAKARLPAPSGKGLPFIFAHPAPGAYPAAPLAYSPAIQAIVDSISQSRLYSGVCDLSGENSVTVGGETYVISTRFSLTEMGAIAAGFLKEQFETLGVDVEIDYTGLLSALRSVEFPVDNLRGWAVGGEGAIIHTEDGGGLWTEQRFGGILSYNGISMLDATRGTVVSEAGAILTTTDGHTWEEVLSPTDEDLRAVVLVDSLTGYCCGSAGTILKTEDGGVTWDSLASGTANDLRGIYFADEMEGWAVGAGGLILHTVDAGSTWVGAASPVTTALNSICGMGHDLAWICGAGGVVLLTQDGSTWQQISTPATQALLSISFINETTGWACGRGGELIVTTDSGFTWNDIGTGGPTFWDVCFRDENEGWLVGYWPIGTTEAALLHTTNGGSDWADQSDAVESGYRNVVATMPGTANPDEIYIICGHYDSISEDRFNYAPGADDNATGTLATLEVARVFRDHRFEATLKFICFAAEEQGLFGSAAYAREASQRGDSIVAVVNFDMIGYADSLPEELEVVYNTASTWLANEYDAVAAMYVPDLGVRTRFDEYAGGSDHFSFWENGYVAVEGIEDRPLVNPHWHYTTDRVSTLDFGFYTEVVKSGAAVLAEMARLDTTASSVDVVGAPDYWKITPNPCRSGAEISMAARDASEMGIEFYDVRGRLVSKAEARAAQGGLRVYWEAKDLSGNMLSPGVYFVRSAPGNRVAKIVVLK
jgi:photosystem II stability/assembly factor-like uncharacterized protein